MIYIYQSCQNDLCISKDDHGQIKIAPDGTMWRKLESINLDKKDLLINDEMEMNTFDKETKEFKLI